MKNLDIINKKNFCIQPWIHLATWNDGSVPLCCIASPENGLNLNNMTPTQVWNSEQFKSARLAFINEKKIPQCNSCWKEESSGIKSHRIIENELWERQLGSEYLENLINSTNNDGSLSSKPLTLDLRLGNTCNLQCVMCRPRDSSKWLQDAKKLSTSLVDARAKADWIHKANSIVNIDCFYWFERLETQESLNEFIGDVRHIIFGGGEPLLIKEHDRFIKKLVETEVSQNIKLRYHTNGTQLSEKILELWSHFKEVELLISIDDWAERNYYIRYPAKWSTILSNLNRLDNTPDNIVINILATVHAMNIYNLPDFAMNVLNQKWKKICSRNSGIFFVGSTHWPQYMNIQVLPKLTKQFIMDKWNSYEILKSNKFWTNRICSQLNFMNSADASDNFSSFIDYIDKLDNIRPIKFADVYSEYYKLLKK